MYQSNFVIEKITLKKTNKLEQHVKNYYVSLALLYSSILYFYVKIYVNHDTSRGDVAFQ